MTTEELLQPRYKVIADYPFNPYTIGNLVTITLTRALLTVTSEWSEWENGNVDVENYVPVSRLDEYPALFKKIGWWEERDVKDMPEYVKIPHYPNGEKDFTIQHVDGDLVKHDFTKIGYFGLKYKHHHGGTIATMFTPATEQEYNEYKSKNK